MHLEIETLSAMIDGDLDPRSIDDAQRHLESCPDCRRTRAELESIRALAAAPLLDPPAPDLWPQISAQLDRPSPAERFAAWIRGPRIAWVTAGAMALLALFFALRPAPPLIVPPPAPFAGEIASARHDYLQAIARLGPAAEESQGRLPAEVRKKLVTSLEAVDRSIADCERALVAAPDDSFGQEILLALYDEKVRVLRASIEADHFGGAP